MASNQLHRLNNVTSMLLNTLSSDDELPSWVQSKITRAYTDLNDVFGYLGASVGRSDDGGPQEKETRPLGQHPHEAEGWQEAARSGEKGYPKSLDV